jgi:hypothetical protein
MSDTVVIRARFTYSTKDATWIASARGPDFYGLSGTGATKELAVVDLFSALPSGVDYQITCA